MAMTGMALLCYLGHCELQDSPDFGPTVRKAIDFITSTTPEPEIKGGKVHILIQSEHMHFVKHIP